MTGARAPGPSRWSALRQLMVMSRDRLGMMTAAAAGYGDAVRIPVGHKTLHFFNHPDTVRHVLADNAGNYRKGIGLTHARRALGDGLLTSEGKLWHKQRRVVQPSFQAKRLARQAGAVAQEAERLVRRLRKQIGGDAVDMAPAMTDLTLGILGRTLLDADLTPFGGLGAAFDAVQNQAMFELTSLSTVPMWVPLAHQRRFRRARSELQMVVDQLVAGRRDDAAGRDDVLSRLIVSAGQEDDPRVVRTRLRDELVTLLLAGHETTASTLSWTLAMIDQHPEVRERLHAEAVTALGSRLPTHADLRRLPYTTMVVEEAMRLYPPVWLLPRQALAADEIGGYGVPAGADVLVCPYTLHRHPALWDDPQRFDPERFDPARTRSRPRYSYIPFGAGPRVCVGSNLAMMEAVFVIAMLSRELRLVSAAGHRPQPQPMLSLRMRGGLPMTVHAA